MKIFTSWIGAISSQLSCLNMVYHLEFSKSECYLYSLKLPAIYMTKFLVPMLKRWPRNLKITRMAAFMRPRVYLTKENLCPNQSYSSSYADMIWLTLEASHDSLCPHSSWPAVAACVPCGWPAVVASGAACVPPYRLTSWHKLLFV